MSKSDQDRTADRIHLMDANVEHVERLYLQFKEENGTEPVVLVIDPRDSVGQRLMREFRERHPDLAAQSDERFAKAEKDGLRPTWLMPVSAESVTDNPLFSEQIRETARLMLGTMVCVVAIAEEGKTMKTLPFPGTSPGGHHAALATGTAPSGFQTGYHGQAADLMVIVVEVSETDSEIEDHMRTMKSGRDGDKVKNIVLNVGGYEDDPRELPDIPEVQTLCERLVRLGLISFLDFSTLSDAPSNPFREAARAGTGPGLGALEVWLIAQGLTPGPDTVTEERFEEFVEVLRGTNAVADAKVGAPTPGPTGSGKVGRNDPCPCGSGKKYKKCCGAN